MRQSEPFVSAVRWFHPKNLNKSVSEPPPPSQERQQRWQGLHRGIGMQQSLYLSLYHITPFMFLLSPFTTCTYVFFTP